ncbi:MAG: hypothetical protein Q4D13_05230 [Erysipelotrichaceae bacterium]|nr:hypothetical protein [Erysipelotrichaceae bacterium]
MALVKCKECGKEISSKAATCPHCGCPLDGDEEQVVSREEKKVERVSAYSENSTKIDTKKNSNAKIIVMVVVMILGFSIGFRGCSKKTDNTTVENPADAVVEPVVEEKPIDIFQLDLIKN